MMRLRYAEARTRGRLASQMAFVIVRDDAISIIPAHILSPLRAIRTNIFRSTLLNLGIHPLRLLLIKDTVWSHRISRSSSEETTLRNEVVALGAKIRIQLRVMQKL